MNTSGYYSNNSEIQSILPFWVIYGKMIPWKRSGLTFKMKELYVNYQYLFLNVWSKIKRRQSSENPLNSDLAMKKLFSKIDSTGQPNPVIGKVFTVGKYNVTVEYVIAQGKVHLKDMKLF